MIIAINKTDLKNETSLQIKHEAIQGQNITVEHEEI